VFTGGGDRDGGNIFGVIAMRSSPRRGGAHQMALSGREFEADRSGAARSATAGLAERSRDRAAPKQVPMKVDPRGDVHHQPADRSQGRGLNFANLFTTHPPTAERIARLRGESS
jgi:heat shock protein HtpX